MSVRGLLITTYLTYLRETNSELQSGELYVEQSLLPCN